MALPAPQPQRWSRPMRVLAGGLLGGSFPSFHILPNLLREGTEVLPDARQAEPPGVEETALRAHTHESVAQTALCAEDQEGGLVRGEGVLYDVALLQEDNRLGVGGLLAHVAVGRCQAAELALEHTRGPALCLARHPATENEPGTPQAKKRGPRRGMCQPPGRCMPLSRRNSRLPAKHLL